MRTKLSRIAPKFEKFLDEIKVGRIKKGTSKKMLSNARLTLAMTRLPNVEDIKQFMIGAEIKDES